MSSRNGIPEGEVLEVKKPLALPKSGAGAKEAKDL